jgi:hypothetical protein
MFSRCIFVLVTSALLAPSPATAQTPTPDPARRYPLPTYDENWQFLGDPDRHADPLDNVKYLPLGDGMFASFGGEARESYERFGNQNFGLSVPSPNGYLLQRYLLHADVHLGRRRRERASRPPGDRGRVRTYVFTTRRSECSLKLRRLARDRTNRIMAVRCLGSAPGDDDTGDIR